MTESVERLLAAIAARTAPVAVVGAGYVGLTAAVQAARAGFPVTAIDVDAGRVAQLSAGHSYITDIADSDLAGLVAAGRLSATTDFDRLQSAAIILICVPTPLTPNRVPDLTYVQSAASEVAARLRPGQLVSLESTTYPGTTEELLLPLLSRAGLQAGQDFFLTFCPERVDPGNPDFRQADLPRVIGGVTAHCREVGTAFYGAISKSTFPVRSTRTAELAKLYENTYRAVNIALVNELAMLCDRMGIDVWEVLDAAATKPFGIQVFRPGPGVGGHCIPLDPHYLAWKAREFDFTLRFVELAGEINDAMPYFVVAKLSRLLNDRGKPLHGAHVLVLGVAYKRDVADVRESPALRIIRLLRACGVELSYHDPHVPVLAAGHEVAEAMQSVPLTVGTLASTDAALVITDHSSVDYALVAAHAPLVLDTRNALKDPGADRSHIWRL